MQTRDGRNPTNLQNADENLHFYALVSLYTRPDEELLDESCRTLWACRYTGDTNLAVVDVKSILSVVSVQPLPKQLDRDDGLWFIVEKTGVEEIENIGFGDDIDGEDADEI
ncbi:hypothetical protein VKT23_015096 [Stygiomarasmius scandens]|uniref:Uncharacterized protein n=1 Tax=Marasmiellus scandens TaxID=2682957 RepID=A0ABR1IZY5_9AGAR